ncbi:Cyanobacterial phytochrome B [Hypsizygus marmoreus]|uniref:Cyanobacterial phytochrome B n=1 Tax=Hypsizygus marmoreus TaxID=39966 RepID=A0A369JC30_HYPMA|nr:Cyanobacterial phytochrome B [Hypsizygus marmoreus]
MFSPPNPIHSAKERTAAADATPAVCSTATEEIDARPNGDRVSEGSASRFSTRNRTTSDIPNGIEVLHSSSSRQNTRHRHLSSDPNFRHFPAGNSSIPQSFSSHQSGGSPTRFPPLATIETINHSQAVFASQVLPVNFVPDRETTSPNPIEAPLKSNSSSSSPKDTDLPFNPSEYGLVHLPPLTISPISASIQTPAPSHEENIRQDDPGTSLGPEEHTPLYLGPLNPLVQVGSPSDSISTSRSSHTAADPQVAFRYEHAEDEHGNHVVLGREGKLAQCEDEPIRTPGAVQAFGVLIAVQEMEDALVVRQVSENSTELLGLSPNFLFSLECLTDTLPESQAGLLWDNLQFLAEVGNSPEDDGGESPHVFLLSGWGAPGTESSNVNNGRRSWTCWCAAHRSAQTSDPESEPSDLIILEFEWERDTLNPLYPPAPPPKVNSKSFSSSTPSSPSVSSSDGSGQAIMDLGGDRALLPQDSPTINDATPSSKSGTSVITGSTDNVKKAYVGSLSFDFGLEGQEDWLPSTEEVLESTKSHAKPLPALERLRRMKIASAPPVSEDHDKPSSPSHKRSLARRRRTGNESSGVGMMDVFAVMGQINEQLGAVTDLDTFLKVVVGVVKDLTQFHRVLVYQFDEAWNGQVVAELVDWSQTNDLYRGLHFPASDIPAQARALYAINKVRLLYDRSQPTARIVVRNKEDLETPLNMTHCYLRAMSPIHIKYLANMGVRASMSVSIMAFGALWGLVTCHAYGVHGMRVSFPVRQMLRLLSQAISKNLERLSYAQRLHTRKLINTMVSDKHPTGYIVSNADDLLGLFDADFGILVIGEGAKILGPNQHGQEILIMAEYLRLKQFNTIQASQAVAKDFPDLHLTAGLEVLAGLLLVPLSNKGTDFIAFLRKGQPRQVKWAGKPYKDGAEEGATLEPRKSFKIWAETVAGRCRVWTDEQLETAGVLALVYGKFIEVWRQKESAVQTTRLTEILLSNASHEVRTPLNHIINYLEMALNGPLDVEARENLSRSHAASKSLLFTINDLLDLTRLESGNETSFNEPFDLRDTIDQATRLYRKEAERRDVQFRLELEESPRMVVGDAKKIRTVVQNLTANSLKYTPEGSITVRCTTYGEPEGLRGPHQTAAEIVVTDTGCGIPTDKLEHIFREFEQVESFESASGAESGVGLGLAVVARIVEQLGGQLRVDSKVDEGSRFSFLIPLALSTERTMSPESISSSRGSDRSPAASYRGTQRRGSSHSVEIENLVEVLSLYGSSPRSYSRSFDDREHGSHSRRSTGAGSVEVVGSQVSVRPVKIDGFDLDSMRSRRPHPHLKSPLNHPTVKPSPPPPTEHMSLRILIVEDNDINRTILAKRLTMDGHTVVNTTNGQEGLNKVESDRAFDAVLMDIQMPILNGFEATQKIREVEKASPHHATSSPRRLSHEIHGHIPIFAVSASLLERQRDELRTYGMDGWILKPIDFRRLKDILKGVTDPLQKERDLYRPGCNWELGGWL